MTRRLRRLRNRALRHHLATTTLDKAEASWWTWGVARNDTEAVLTPLGILHSLAEAVGWTAYLWIPSGTPEGPDQWDNAALRIHPAEDRP